ncbi:hypothetical protein [Deinococcus enclensis]|uniref:Uncharacterized protein n=1 Tax=Deinococcus enclensis TaxID=1049582 RepID=A0ABT9MGE8_9DEIO|nr:hypothetical protein [Deinococcus enclensis]MDP9765284.1 hypothetical protein [Deinococcus enclensis]
MSFHPLKRKPTTPANLTSPGLSSVRPITLAGVSPKVKPLQVTTPSPGFLKTPDGTFRSELDATQLRKARGWYAANASQYTPAVIRQIQSRLREAVTGRVTDAFLQAVALWQTNFDLYGAAGRGTSVGKAEYSGYTPTGVLTPEQLSRLFPSGLAKPTQVAAYATNAEDLIARWNAIGGYDGRRKALYALLEQQMKAAGVLMPKLVLSRMEDSLLGVYSGKEHSITINSGFLTKANTEQEDIRILLQTLYHEARHAEQNFAIARLMHGTGMTSAAVYTQTGMNMKLVQAAAKKPLRPDTPEGIVANEWYQSKYGAFAAQRNKDLIAGREVDRTIRTTEEALTLLRSRRADIVKKLTTNLPAVEKQRLNTDLALIDQQSKDLNRLLQQLYVQSADYNAKYRALPGERDAWDVEGAVQAYYLRNLEGK